MDQKFLGREGARNIDELRMKEGKIETGASTGKIIDNIRSLGVVHEFSIYFKKVILLHEDIFTNVLTQFLKFPEIFKILLHIFNILFQK